MINQHSANLSIGIKRRWHSWKDHFQFAAPVARALFIGLLTRSLFPAIVAMVGAVAGLTASVYSSELKSAIPLLRQGANWNAYNSNAIAAAGWL